MESVCKKWGHTKWTLFATGALRAVLITRQIHAGVPSTCKRAGRLAEAARSPFSSVQTPPSPPQTPWRLFGPDCMCINAYVMAWAYYVCFPIVCWKLWFMIASLVYSPLSCGPVRLSAPANRGGLEATEMFNKCLWARGSQVITSSHRRAHKHTPPHRHALHSRLLILRWIDDYPPARQMFRASCLKDPPTAHTSSFNLFLSSALKRTA